MYNVQSTNAYRICYQCLLSASFASFDNHQWGPMLRRGDGHCLGCGHLLSRGQMGSARGPVLDSVYILMLREYFQCPR